MIKCIHCYSSFTRADDQGCCPDCGSNPSLRPDHENVFEQNAKTLGFADKKLLDEAPSWSKVGSVIKKPSA